MVDDDLMTDKEISKALIHLYDEVCGAGDGECEHGFWYEDCPNKECLERDLQEEFLNPILNAANFISLRDK